MGELMDKLRGRLKRLAGAASGERRLERRGKAEEAKGEAKGEFERAKQEVKEAFREQPPPPTP